MRYAKFDNQADAESFVMVVQAACDAVQDQTKPKIIIEAFKTWDNKFAVAMPVEPDVLQGEIVDSIDPPQEPIG